MKVRLAAAAVAATAVAVGGAAAPASADPIIPVPCPIGYVCLETGLTTTPLPHVIRVREGDAQKFPGGLATWRVTNNTRLNYCVDASVNYGLRPGAFVVRKDVVTSVSPGVFCVL
jgi:hypothetical protein